jgi:tetratricopeptide (TPR) repeat protein
MRALQNICIIVALTVLGASALADQNDPRLDDLFAQLQEVASPSDAVPIERQIWDAWLVAPDEAVDALMSAGAAKMRRGDFAAALTAFDEVVELAPGFAEGWNKRATVHYLMGSFELSLNDIEETLQLEPRHFGALSGRGLVYVNLEDLERALDAFEAALVVNPQMLGPRANVEAILLILQEREI